MCITRWYAVAAPWRGAAPADLIAEVCAHGQYGLALQMIAKVLGFCSPDGNATQSLMALRTDYIDWEPTIQIARRHVAGSMCGTGVFGIGSAQSLAFEGLSQIVSWPHEEANDGLVGLSSCILSGDSDGHNSIEFSATPGSVNYLTSGNHVDTTCRNGDKRDDASLRPCEWYTQRVDDARRSILSRQ